MNAALEDSWTAFAEKLGGFIRSRVADPATADDIRQEVFLKLHRRLQGSGSVANIEAWLFRTARNAVIDHYRTRKKSVALPDSLAAQPVAEDGEFAGLRAAFRRMIASLPDPYREAVTLADLEGLKQADVAARLGISLSGAKSRVQRGREQLKAMLDACCVFEFDRRGGVIDCTPRPAATCQECPPDPS